MPIHDWTRVNAGIFHHFHQSWIGEIARALNTGLLPPDFYALAEQITGDFGPDVLTLRVPRIASPEPHEPSGGVALAEDPPRVRFHVKREIELYAEKANAVVVRHRSNHDVIAMIEIVSPGNKNNRREFDAFVKKADEILKAGIHLLIVDLFPPGPRDPQGIHRAIWGDGAEDDAVTPPPDKPLTCAAYIGGRPREGFVEPGAVGDPLPEMPLFLTPDVYVRIPLETTYRSAWDAVPAVWRDALTAAPER
jgi:hypothetical protein